MEAELLSGIKVEYEIEYEKVVAHFLDLGVKKVFITLGIDGVAYGDENEIFIDKNKIISPVNTTGAGDAFMAGILYGETKGMELYDMVQFCFCMCPNYYYASRCCKPRYLCSKGFRYVSIMIEKLLEINSEVKKALLNNSPIVALESTIISHGMPYPQNIETAQNVEQIVRDNGAIPATIALLNGKIKVGLNESEIDYLAKSGNKIVKASRRDLPYLLSQKIDGATTVASTMIAANLAGIRVFATGGIGGVHRGASESFDISADLQELANTNVAVVCAGIKAILDLGLTLEYLETFGIPVLGYQTDELPAFYTQKSGFKVNYKMETATEIAKLLKTKWELDLKGGVIITNPVPKDKELDFKLMNNAIDKALIEEKKSGIKGKDSTPFLLGKVKEFTDGLSLNANIELVYNNAKLAAQIANEYVQ